MFGGEYFNGSVTQVYNDLFFYNISKNEWRRHLIPNPPPARSAHQAVAIDRNGGEMWLFGGEFTTPNGSQFKTYRDLWVLRFAASTSGEDSKAESKGFVWEEIKLKTGPPARSGHRMIYHKRKLIVFGGFFDNGVGDVQYYNDLWTLDLDAMTWVMINNKIMITHVIIIIGETAHGAHRARRPKRVGETVPVSGFNFSEFIFFFASSYC